MVINLKKRFGKQYRVRHEESLQAENSEFRTEEEPWLQIILCQRGHIYPYGEELLAVSTDHRGKTSNKIMSLPYVKVLQEGDDGINATFPAKHFDEIAKIMGARRKRQMSPEQRAASMERLAKYGFQHASQSTGGGQERIQTPQVDTLDHLDHSARFRALESSFCANHKPLTLLGG